MSRCTRVCAQLSILLLLPLSASAETESWYTYWGLGFANISYPGEMNQSIKKLRKQSGVRSVSVSQDLLGFYWPLEMGGHSIMGVVANVASERLTEGGGTTQHNLGLIGASLMHFLGSEPGDGFFVRGDLGVGFAGTESSDGTSSDSDAGMGVLMGVGYGFPVTEGTRVLINTNYAYRRIEGESWNVLSLAVGGLF